MPRIPNHITHNSQKPSRKAERQHDLIHKHENSPSRHFTRRHKLQLQHPETTSFCEFPRIPDRITHTSQKASQETQRQTQELIASTASGKGREISHLVNGERWTQKQLNYSPGGLRRCCHDATTPTPAAVSVLNGSANLSPH